MSYDICKQKLLINDKNYTYYNINLLGNVAKLPKSLKVLLENLARNFDDKTISSIDFNAVIDSTGPSAKPHEIAFYPARVLMQDFTGVPAVVDLAAMRDAMKKSGGDVEKVNPLIPVDLVIDHSVMVDSFGNQNSFDENVRLEYERNIERYTFLKWGQKSFKNFRVVPPGTGICHQVNLEYLANVVFTKELNGEVLAFPDTVVGTDSHTTMINGLSVLGWGVGGIEAEAAMLGQPQTMLIPEVVGMRLTGQLKAGVTATDLVLTVTNILRSKGVVGKFVEFYGDGLKYLSLADRATIANMAPEYGATCGFFPIDSETINYLKLTNRTEAQIALTEAYAKAQGLWDDGTDPIFKDKIELDLNTVEPTMAGPKRPQDKILLKDIKKVSLDLTADLNPVSVEGKDFSVKNHDVVIAAITSCTNTSNPSVLIAAGLLARKARALGLKAKPWVKTSLAPGSQVVTEYLQSSGLLEDLENIGFYLVGYGCTTCIGNSGPIDTAIAKAIDSNDLTVAGVLSGNRNFEGRINPHVKANYLASPPLVVAFALAGTTNIDVDKEPICQTSDSKDVFLKDLWPNDSEIKAIMQANVTPEAFAKRYSTVFDGDGAWQKIASQPTQNYAWQADSTYIKHPPYFDMANQAIDNIRDAQILALLGDSVTTDHISPAGNIKASSPAGQYLNNCDVTSEDFNSYGARRGNHEVMMRGTFANIRLKNEMVPGVSGGFTNLILNNQETQTTIYDAAMSYMQSKVPLVIVAGKEYGTGSSRDWAAKGTRLLGIKAVIAESFERIHRSNLVGMGVLPLEFPVGINRKTLKLTGKETILIEGLENGLKPKMILKVTFSGNTSQTIDVVTRIDTDDEVQYFMKGGILPYVFAALSK
jgi:aconitate hydratase